jgi:hypothetical protein
MKVEMKGQENVSMRNGDILNNCICLNSSVWGVPFKYVYNKAESEENCIFLTLHMLIP